MIEFADGLEKKITQVLTDSVGATGTDPTNFIVTFDDHISDYQVEQFPVLVVFLREGDKKGDEINAPQGMKDYLIHIYYMDLVSTAQRPAGKTKRSNLMSRIEKTVNNNPRFDAFETLDDDGTREYIWHSELTSFNLDDSGLDEYHQFIGEMYFTVHSAT